MTESSGFAESAAVVASSVLLTFLIADIRGYTRFTEERGDEAAAHLADRFAEIVKQIVAGGGGDVLELRGDEALAFFRSARSALRVALDLQDRFRRETSEHPDLPLQVGIGLDAGEVVPVQGGFRGGAINLAARLCSSAGPGEVLASEGVIHLARKVHGLTYLNRGRIPLKGFAEPVGVLEVVRGDGDAPTSVQDRTRSLPDLPVGGYLGSLPDGPIIARDQEREQIMTTIDAVLRGTGQLLVLAGEPGVGKTRLAQDVTVALRTRGFLATSGRCYQPQQAMPLYPIQSALSTLFAEARSTIQTTAGQRWPLLAPLLPDHLPAKLPLQGSDPQGLFRAITGFVRAVAEESPVAILLDDLHWSDSASVELLCHLTRGTRQDRVFLLATYRDTEVAQQHPLGRALFDLQREELAERISIRRWDEEETSAFIASALGESDISREFGDFIFGRTGGNPYFVQQVLRMLVEQGDVFRRDGAWARADIAAMEVPQGVRALIGQRLAHLPEETQSILHEASVLGQNFVFDDLQTMTQRTEEEIEDALEDCRSAALVKIEGKDAYAFDHALTQQTLYAAIPPRRRRRLHLAAGEAIESASKTKRYPQDHSGRHPQGTRRVAELAWHFLQGDDPARAFVYAVMAGDQAEALLAHGEAEQQFRTALELAQASGDDLREANAAEKLGDVLTITGRYDEALAALERALVFQQRAARIADEVRILASIGVIHASRGTTQEAIERLRACLQTLNESDWRGLRTPVLISLSLLLAVNSQYPEAVEAGEQAALLAKEAGDTRLLIQAERRRLGALSKLGSSLYNERQAFEEVCALAEDVGDLDTLYSALNSLGDVYLVHGDRDKSTGFKIRAAEVAERLGDPSAIAFMTFKLGWNAFDLGDWPQARIQLERSLATARSAGASQRVPYPLFGFGLLYVATGEWDHASAVLDEGILLSGQIGDLQIHRFLQWVAADKDLLAKRPDLARARLEPLLDRANMQEMDVTVLLPLLAEAHLQMNDLYQAAAIAVEALKRARVEHDPDALLNALRVQGMVLADTERWEEAAACLEEGLTMARAMTYPYAEGRILHEFGNMHTRKGDSVAARERLEQACSIFQRLGARPYIELTEEALSALE